MPPPPLSWDPGVSLIAWAGAAFAPKVKFVSLLLEWFFCDIFLFQSTSVYPQVQRLVVGQEDQDTVGVEDKKVVEPPYAQRERTADNLWVGCSMPPCRVRDLDYDLVLLNVPLSQFHPCSAESPFPRYARALGVLSQMAQGSMNYRSMLPAFHSQFSLMLFDVVWKKRSLVFRDSPFFRRPCLPRNFSRHARATDEASRGCKLVD